MNTSLNFTVEELQTLNNSVNSVKNDIDSTIKNIENCLNELETNITGTSVNSSINSISSSINAVNGKMAVAFQSLNDFLNSQLKNYSTTYANANARLKSVLDFINNNF